MRKLFQIFFAAALCILTVLSCTEEGSTNIVYKGKKELVFSDKGGEQTIQFDTPELWTASVTNTGTTEERDWVLIGSTSGDAGDNALKITVMQNSGDKERTAALSVFCGDDVLVVSIVQGGVSHGGGNNVPDVPEQVTGSRVSRIAITYGEYKDIYKLKYDNKYVAEMAVSRFEGGIELGKPDVVNIIRENSIVIMEYKYWNGDYNRFETEDIKITLDEKGRAVNYSMKGFNESRDYEVSYDSDGNLSQFRKVGISFPENVFLWIGGNMTGVEWNKTYPTKPGSGGSQEAPDYTTKEEFRYSEYKNNANLDLNWVLSGGYDTDWAIVGVLNLLGERSANYVVPNSFFYDEETGMSLEPIPSDGEYTYTVFSGFQAEEETVAEYRFNGELLTAVKASIPKYRVETEYKVYRTINNYMSYTEGPDGQKLYFDYNEKIISKTEKSRKKIGSEEILFEIEY